MAPGVLTAEERERLVGLVDAGGVAFWRYLHIALEEVHDVGHVTLRMPMRADLETRRPGVMHGGALASLIDAACGGAVTTLRRADDDTWTGQATTDLNITYLNAATTDVLAEGRVLRSGRAIAYAQAEIRDLEGNVVAVGRATYMILRR
ncbi:MAG: PaaI family thioesterase [Dehalococcoidia bacterium]|nr:PaaI family thioesterase [Dehalococcoidia bacterium]